MSKELVAGHRERAKNKFINTEDHSNLGDYELLELALFYSIPRKDVKPLAKKLIAQFGNLGNLLNTSQKTLKSIPGIGTSSVVLLSLLKAITQRVSKEQILEKPIINSWDKLITYARSSIGYKSTENLHTLFLNTKNRLIADEIHNHGTVDSISVYPREIVKSALYHDASSVILIHNHPSGSTKPSKADLKLTESILQALDSVNITLIDHVIISSNSYFSFKAHDLL